jgi:hypothetical protein
MYRLTLLITLRDDAGAEARDRLDASLGAAALAGDGLVQSYLEPALPRNLNGGDLIWHVTFADEAAARRRFASAPWRDAEAALASDAVSHVDRVGYWQELRHIGRPDMAGGIHRTLLIAMRPGAAAADIARFEGEMREMADHLPCIRNWAFSRVSDSSGARRWTHVWEQDFDDESALFGPYLMHPIHFGHIDRWFDAQSQDFIVDTHICHTFCAVERSALAADM